VLEIEVLGADEVDRAAKILLRDGFVAIGDALVGEQLERTQAAADRVIQEFIADDPERKGNRGHHRYSFGNQMRHPEWCELVALPHLLPIVAAIWNSEDFICAGAGGDFSLPGAEIQPLHSDRNEMGFTDPWVEHVSYRDLPPPNICINFMMVDFTKQNGAIRQVPCTQRSTAPIPILEEEPPWMKNCLVCAPAGTALFRDIRCWHGGTPNRSEKPRPMMNVHYCAPWFRQRTGRPLPAEHYEKMSERGKQLCRHLVKD
jgi:ectoine hydroxylase-related dioxygenase (phytanoyl-CoA dioxygenase family)